MKLYNTNGDVTVQAVGRTGSLVLGGGVSDGELVIKNHDNEVTLLLDGGSGDIRIKGASIKPADFVFDAQYELPQLEAVSTYVQQHGHLPGVPSGETMRNSGIGLTEFSMTLLQKVEELTLYVIEQNQTIRDLQAEVAKMKA